MNVCELIYSAAGRPGMGGDAVGVCRGCGTQGVGLLFDKWVKDTFTNHDELYPGTIICRACLFCFAEQNEVLTKKLGKDKPQKCRSYSHFIVDGTWYALSKGEKAKIKELIFQEPQVAVIADSGQKHLIFRARPGWWQFEEQRLLPCPELLREVLTGVESLYNAGASKEEIESGDYKQFTIMRIGVKTWQLYESGLRKHRGSLRFTLAIFLAQKGVEGGTTTDSR